MAKPPSEEDNYKEYGDDEVQENNDEADDERASNEAKGPRTREELLDWEEEKKNPSEDDEYGQDEYNPSNNSWEEEMPELINKRSNEAKKNPKDD